MSVFITLYLIWNHLVTYNGHYLDRERVEPNGEWWNSHNF